MLYNSLVAQGCGACRCLNRGLQATFHFVLYIPLPSLHLRSLDLFHHFGMPVSSMFAVCRRGSRPSICYFLVLPLEIRNIIYEFFIKAALDYYSPPIYGLQYWQTGRYHEHKFDLAITTSKVVFRNVRYPGHLLTVIDKSMKR